MNGVLVAPYEELFEIAQQLKREKKWDLEVVLGDLHEGARLAQECVDAGAHYVISRGGTYRLIKRVVRVPVVEIRVSVDELFDQVSHLSRRRTRLGLAGFENVIRSHRSLSRLLGIPIEYIPYEDPAQVRRALIEAAGKGVETFLTDAVGSKTASALGIEHTLIRSSREAIIEAVELAASMAMERGVAPGRPGKAGGSPDRQPRIEHLVPRVESRVPSAKYTFSDIICASPRMRAVIDRARSYALLDSPVLITGETGTGKELVAHSIHNASHRRQRPFVIVACGAIPPDLLTSEFMGYTDGAFTGARRIGRRGLLETADGGTLFLDEVEDLPPEAQGLMLRFLQEGEVRRLGDNRLIRLDVRVIAATNQDLAQLVDEHRFRKDLYYRLNVLSVVLPPLRERREDIPALTDHFVRIYAESTGKPVHEVDVEAREMLAAHDYPGNVRELQSVIQRAVAAAGAGTITAKEIEAALDRGNRTTGWTAGTAASRTCGRTDGKASAAVSVDAPPQQRVLSLKQMEMELVREALGASGGNITLAARMLGVSRSTLWRKMKSYSL